jgi:hypothetical protein
VAAWTALALAGLAIAVTVTYTATRLVGEHIGLSAEPRIEGSRLVAPAPSARPVAGGSTDAVPDVRRAARIVGTGVAAVDRPAAPPSTTEVHPPTDREHGDDGDARGVRQSDHAEDAHSGRSDDDD